jgi:hypothetical protein
MRHALSCATLQDTFHFFYPCTVNNIFERLLYFSSYTDCKFLKCRTASASCGLPVFSAIVLSYWKLLVAATEDGQDVKESSEVCSLLYTRHFYFYNFVPTWPFPSFLKKKMCGTRKIYLGANGRRLLRKHNFRLGFLWMKGLREGNSSHVWTCHQLDVHQCYCLWCPRLITIVLYWLHPLKPVQ